jgi:hypothetical protein
MNTHDEETKKFFKNTGVRCILAPRYADDKVSWVRQKVHSQNHLKSFKLAKQFSNVSSWHYALPVFSTLSNYLDWVLAISVEKP